MSQNLVIEDETTNEQFDDHDQDDVEEGQSNSDYSCPVARIGKGKQADSSLGERTKSPTMQEWADMLEWEL